MDDETVKDKSKCYVSKSRKKGARENRDTVFRKAEKRAQ